VEHARLDFEDGYGTRPDSEEDGHAAPSARAVARGLAEGTVPPFVGIRVKPLTGELGRRAIRTLDIFLTTLADEAEALPDGFCVTLPKLQDTEQVQVLDEALSELESKLAL